LKIHFSLGILTKQRSWASYSRKRVKKKLETVEWLRQVLLGAHRSQLCELHHGEQSCLEIVAQAFPFFSSEKKGKSP